MKTKAKEKPQKSPYNKQWILDTGIPIVQSYYGNLTLRGLHYRLVANGMTNDEAHYKKVVSTMTYARWEGMLAFDCFQDHERETIGRTAAETTIVEDEIDYAFKQINYWAKVYDKNRWENQPIYVEVFIEKKALQGVFDSVCRQYNVALSPCKGYPSITFLNDAKNRFEKAIQQAKEPVILYFGDYDCSGEDIPRSIKESLEKMGIDVEVRRIALMEHQVIKWNLPPAPTKSTDSRSANWNGLGQVELDAVEPNQIRILCEDAIRECFDDDLYEELIEAEKIERKVYQDTLKIKLNEAWQ